MYNAHMKNKNTPKTKVFLASILAILMVLPLTSCSKQLPRISYGSLYYTNSTPTTNDNYSEITLNDFAVLVSNHETFLVATMGQSGKSCLCFTTFTIDVIQSFIAEESIPVFILPYEEVSGVGEGPLLGLVPSTSSMTFNIYVKGQNKHRETETSNKDLFNKASSFKNYVFDRVARPFMFRLNLNNFSELLTKNEKFIMYFGWNLCSDCAYLEENVFPNYNPKTINLKIYRLECAEFRPSPDPENVWYNFADTYGLSKTYNEMFGYNVGHVPIFQVVDPTKGNTHQEYVIDSAVYFNDAVAKNEENNSYYISRSFYTSERIANLGPWAQNGAVTPLLNNVIPADQVSGSGSGWLKEFAAVPHTSYILKMFEYYIGK